MSSKHRKRTASYASKTMTQNFESNQLKRKIMSLVSLNNYEHNNQAPYDPTGTDPDPATAFSLFRVVRVFTLIRLGIRRWREKRNKCKTCKNRKLNRNSSSGGSSNGGDEGLAENNDREVTRVVKTSGGSPDESDDDEDDDDEDDLDDIEAIEMNCDGDGEFGDDEDDDNDCVSSTRSLG